MSALLTKTVTDTSGQAFRIEHHFDSDMEPPWANSDGHGIVTDWVRRAKRPGELILNSDGRGFFRYYDFQATIKIARRDHWNSWNMLQGAKERGDELVRAVMMDYQYLRDWCHDKWHYMGIEVFPLTPDGDELRSKRNAMWGIESEGDPAYVNEVEVDLLRECGAELH